MTEPLDDEREQMSRRSRRLAHTAWASVGIIISLLLLLTGQQGHPPAVIFLPHVLVAWAVGHSLIWGVQQLAARGRRAVTRSATDTQSWPVELRLAVAGTGIAALVGIVQVVGTFLAARWYPYHDAGLWAAMLMVWLAHAACLAGLLLRRRWSRLLSAALTFGWTVLLGMQIAEQLRPGSSSDHTGVFIAGGLMALLLSFGSYLVCSRKAKSFLIH